MSELTHQQMHLLHTYYVRASSIREDVKRASATVIERDALPGYFKGAPEGLLQMLQTMEAMNRLSVFYGLVYLLIEAFEQIGVHDAVLDQLFADPNKDLLRRFRNAIFHFQKDFYESEKVLGFLEEESSVTWIQTVWKEFDRWFADEHLRPLFGEAFDNTKKSAP